jgi:GntR family transcriptional regulator, rspAB operon transcriptional repressor
MKSFTHVVQEGRQQAASQLVYGELRRRILHGEFPPGTFLREEELASLIEVSRTPVREALRALLAEGIVSTGPRRQLVVSEVTDDLVAEATHLRDVGKRLAVEKSLAEAVDPRAIDLLRLIVIRQRRALKSGDINAFMDCDDEFNSGLADAVGLALTVDVLRRTNAVARLAMIGHRPAVATLKVTIDEHEALLDEIESRSSNRANLVRLSEEHTPASKGGEDERALSG